jgi:hypothetical protein
MPRSRARSIIDLNSESILDLYKLLAAVLFSSPWFLAHAGDKQKPRRNGLRRGICSVSVSRD